MIYNLIIHLYGFVAEILALFNPKAKKWIDGRKDFFNTFSSELQLIKTDNQPIIWFHCASLGEFEQGRPLIEYLKQHYKNYKIVLTFFSPSGFEIRKNYEYADFICYLPLDKKRNAQQFIDILEPKLVFWVKYEFWKNYLSTLSKKGIPVFLISGIFRKNHFFFSYLGRFFNGTLAYFTHLFLQNESSKLNLQKINIQHITVAGDTRLDRVLSIAATKKSFPIIERFSQQSTKPIFICGSTWQADEDIICQFINEQKVNLPYQFIIAPHEIKQSNIDSLIRKLEVKATKYSTISSENIPDSEVLIIDNIGILSSLYQYGKIAYIGGAFGAGLHNTLEPIVFGLPVIFGKKYENFEEAKYLVNQKGGFTINNYEDFNKIIQQLENEDFYNKASKIAKEYVEKNKGATMKIMTSKQVNSLLE